MDHPHQQYPFLANPDDLMNAKDMEKSHQHFQSSMDPRQHNYVIPQHFAFQNPFAHQHMQTHMPQMMPQHFAQDFSFGLPYMDAMSHGMMEHDDSNEPTTRPRLTKEQVDFFEREFAANSKPPSTYKRALALQTNIDYNRISNWFQNRRAKAKQQKKQEEFEKSQRKQSDDADEATPQPIAHERDDEEEEEDDVQHHVVPAKASESPKVDRRERSRHNVMRRDGSSISLPASSGPSQSPSPTRQTESPKDKGWASLQRALAAARAAKTAHQHQMIQHHQQQQQEQVQQQMNHYHQPPQNMLPPRLPFRPSISEQVNMGQHQDSISNQSLLLNMSSQSNSASSSQTDNLGWQHQPVTSSAWPAATINASDMHFDFGFSDLGSDNLDEGTELVSPTDTGSQNVMLSADSWDNPMVTPTMPATLRMAYSQPMQSPALSIPVFDQSRRGSIADGLSANFENFGVNGGSPDLDTSPPSSSGHGNDYDTSRTDIAARRKRPIPALAIRSHSYGAPTAKSPTGRPVITPPAPHSLRHSKSAGHGLSSYAGVRKSSIASKSPLGLSYDSNNLDRLMAQNANEINLGQPMMPASANSIAPQRMHDQMMASFQALAQARGQMAEMNQHQRPRQSPPITPFQLGYDSQMPTLVPPTTQGQYANCSETPPFSAGPTTASSCQWSDGGVTSPDNQNFAAVYSLPGYPFINNEDQMGIQQLYSADQNHELGMSMSADKKSSEWFSHTFDGQETVYAQIAQQLGQKGPKEYTFDNTNPNSFREKSHSH